MNIRHDLPAIEAYSHEYIARNSEGDREIKLKNIS